MSSNAWLALPGIFVVIGVLVNERRIHLANKRKRLSLPTHLDQTRVGIDKRRAA